MPRIHHVSNIENASFNPDPVMAQSMFQTQPRPVCRWLSFSSSDDSDTSQKTPLLPLAMMSVKENIQTITEIHNINPSHTQCGHYHIIIAH